MDLESATWHLTSLFDPTSTRISLRTRSRLLLGYTRALRMMWRYNESICVCDMAAQEIGTRKPAERAETARGLAVIY